MISFILICGTLSAIWFLLSLHFNKIKSTRKAHFVSFGKKEDTVKDIETFIQTYTNIAENSSAKTLEHPLQGSKAIVLIQGGQLDKESIQKLAQENTKIFYLQKSAGELSFVQVSGVIHVDLSNPENNEEAMNAMKKQISQFLEITNFEKHAFSVLKWTLVFFLFIGVASVAQYLVNHKNGDHLAKKHSIIGEAFTDFSRHLESNNALFNQTHHDGDTDLSLNKFLQRVDISDKMEVIEKTLVEEGLVTHEELPHFQSFYREIINQKANFQHLNLGTDNMVQMYSLFQDFESKYKPESFENSLYQNIKAGSRLLGITAGIFFLSLLFL